MPQISFHNVLKSWFALLLLFIVISPSLNASTRPESHTWAKSGFEDFSQHIDILEDSERALTIEQVKTTQSSAFQPWRNKGVFNGGHSTSAWWIRLRIPQNTLCLQCILEIPYASLSQITLYTPNGDIMQSGKLIPPEEQPWPHRYFAFPITIKEQDNTLFIRVMSNGPVTVPVLLWKPNAFAQNVQITYLGLAVYYGGISFLALYNLLIYFSLREKLFLSYSLFAISMLLAMLFGNGIAYQYIWPSTWATNEHIQPMLYVLAMLLGTQFSRLFLNTQALMPILDKAIKVALCANALVIIAALFKISEVYEWLAMSACALFSVLLIFCAALRALWMQNRNAPLFLAAWSTLLLGITVAILRNFGWIHTSLITANSVQFSSALEMLLLSFALADRIRHERNAREAAQAETLRIRQTLVENLQASEAQLERAVAQRTAELHRSLENEQALLERYIRFGAFISHEFRNPLAIIKAQIMLLNKETAKGINKIEQRTAAILNASERLSRLFDDWLSSDRLRQVSQELSLSELVLEPWLQRCITEYRERHSQHIIQLSYIQTLPTIIVDEPMLRIALGNLVDNAAKYSPPKTHIKIIVKTTADTLKISIQDYGPGIAHELTEHVFEDYFRAHPDNTPGLGLGLALVKRVIELHGGCISLKSNPGEGCCFTLKLPLTAPNAALGVSVK